MSLKSAQKNYHNQIIKEPRKMLTHKKSFIQNKNGIDN